MPLECLCCPLLDSAAVLEVRRDILVGPSRGMLGEPGRVFELTVERSGRVLQGFQTVE